MAGAGSRFVKEGYKDPKPLIPINGIPMIKVVINNLRPQKVAHRFIFICQQAHIESYGLVQKFQSWAPGCEIVALNGITDGAACTVLAAREFIDNEDSLMIANSDQYVDTNIDDYLLEISKGQLDGLIMTMKANDPKWSFVSLSDEGLVEQVIEKEVISDEATVGIYNFKAGKDFVRAADQMIINNLKVNNEFYVAPTYNQLIEQGMKVGIFNIGSESAGMYGLGTPSDLNIFLNLPVSKFIVE